MYTSAAHSNIPVRAWRAWRYITCFSLSLNCELKTASHHRASAGEYCYNLGLPLSYIFISKAVSVLTLLTAGQTLVGGVTAAIYNVCAPQPVCVARSAQCMTLAAAPPLLCHAARVNTAPDPLH